MSNFLLRPFPRETSLRKSLVNAFASGLIVTIFLLVFNPFEFASSPVKNLFLFACGYGVVTMICVSIVGIIEFLFPALFSESKWTIGKNILLYLIIIFIIGSANLFYTSAATGMQISAGAFLWFQVITLSVTFVVVSATTMIRYFYSTNFYKTGAVEIEKSIIQNQPENFRKIIILRSENEKEILEMPLEDLIMIESADNYSKVYFKKNGILQTTLLRISLKKINEFVSDPAVFRCHRSYIVQLNNIKRVSGNSQGYKIHFENIAEAIPVSRSASEEFKTKTGARH